MKEIEKECNSKIRQKIIAIDLPCFGKSSAYEFKQNDGESNENAMLGIIYELFGKLGLLEQRIILCGHSMGGYISGVIANMYIFSPGIIIKKFSPKVSKIDSGSIST